MHLLALSYKVNVINSCVLDKSSTIRNFWIVQAEGLLENRKSKTMC